MGTANFLKLVLRNMIQNSNQEFCSISGATKLGRETTNRPLGISRGRKQAASANWPVDRFWPHSVLAPALIDVGSWGESRNT